VLVARRGLGAEEERLATPGFLEAVRWAHYAEQLAPALQRSRSVADGDPPPQLLKAGGQELIDFRASRAKAREVVAELEAALFPVDEESSDGG
jgi:hypothetical protein